MQARFTLCVGVPVAEEDSSYALGTIADILIHPDTGRIEGFFVHTGGMFHADMLFLSSVDIIRWGTHVVVRDADVLSPIEDRIRLRTLLDDPRRLLGQAMRTESGKYLGRCKDVQFDTSLFLIEWIFPKRLFRWGVPLPLNQILEVRKDAIIVRDTAVPASDTGAKIPLLEQVPNAA